MAKPRAAGGVISVSARSGGFDRAQKSGDARGAQGGHRLAVAVAQALDEIHRAVADAIDREEDRVGLAHEFAEPRLRLFESAIVMQQPPVSPRDEIAQLATVCGRPPT